MHYYRRNKKLVLLLGIAGAAFAFSVFWLPSDLGKKFLQKSGQQVGSKQTPKVTKPHLTAPAKGDNLAFRLDYYKDTLSKLVNTCKARCAVQCTANGKSEEAKLSCEQACVTYYERRDESSAGEALRTLQNACAKR